MYSQITKGFRNQQCDNIETYQSCIDDPPNDDSFTRACIRRIREIKRTKQLLTDLHKT